ncbi:MAG: acyl-ACP--UDP-N-acetylglucosamine O-acyltransferase [Elusimicrobia bacterium]|nr:acyl-ACP--UDP-N-acetylglucosamine O-acyltransferase [Elusimicrobiota bacterium]
MAKIHPTAVVDPTAKLADDVEVGPGCVVEAETSVGAGTVLRPHAVIRRGTSLGAGNFVDSFAVLGGDPQDLSFDPKTPSFVRIGDRNVFREGVTISRATKPGGATTVGSGTYWMATSHAGHDCAVGDGVILVNAVLLAGHVVVGDRAILAGATKVHQFTWVGEGVMTQGGAGMSMHVPPFTLAANVNELMGLNAVGLRRNPALKDEDRRQIKEAFALVYRSGLPKAEAVARMEACSDWGGPASRFRDFVKRALTAEKPHNRGLCPLGRKVTAA